MKGLVAKPEDPSLIPWTRVVKEEKLFAAGCLPAAAAGSPWS